MVETAFNLKDLIQACVGILTLVIGLLSAGFYLRRWITEENKSLITSLESWVHEMRNDLKDIREHIGETRDTVTRITERQDTQKEEIARQRETLQSLSADVARLQGHVQSDTTKKSGRVRSIAG